MSDKFKAALRGFYAGELTATNVLIALMIQNRLSTAKVNFTMENTKVDLTRAKEAFAKIKTIAESRGIKWSELSKKLPALDNTVNRKDSEFSKLVEIIFNRLNETKDESQDTSGQDGLSAGDADDNQESASDSNSDTSEEDSEESSDDSEEDKKGKKKEKAKSKKDSKTEKTRMRKLVKDQKESKKLFKKLFKELLEEKNSTIISDAVIDVSIQLSESEIVQMSNLSAYDGFNLSAARKQFRKLLSLNVRSGKDQMLFLIFILSLAVGRSNSIVHCLNRCGLSKEKANIFARVFERMDMKDNTKRLADKRVGLTAPRLLQLFPLSCLALSYVSTPARRDYLTLLANQSLEIENDPDSMRAVADQNFKTAMGIPPAAKNLAAQFSVTEKELKMVNEDISEELRAKLDKFQMDATNKILSYIELAVNSAFFDKLDADLAMMVERAMKADSVTNLINNYQAKFNKGIVIAK